MMATLNIEAILDRVQELKRDSEEKDEVIRAQQMQITEMEAKIEALEAQCADQERQNATLGEAAAKADELVERLSQLLS